MSSWGPDAAERTEATAYGRGWWDPSVPLSLFLDALHTTHAVRAAPGQQLSLQGFFLLHPFKFINTNFYVCVDFLVSFMARRPSLTPIMQLFV